MITHLLYSQLSLNPYPYKMDASLKQTPRVLVPQVPLDRLDCNTILTKQITIPVLLQSMAGMQEEELVLIDKLIQTLPVLQES